MNRIVGIDPGASGAIALVRHGELHAVRDMPTVTTKSGKRRVDAGRLATILREFAPSKVWLEDVHAMPGNGSASMFTFGKAAGIAEGCCAGLPVECELVSPQVWKRRLDVPADKHAAIKRATKLFGGSAHWPLKKHDGRAEAALIALYGYHEDKVRNGSGVHW